MAICRVTRADNVEFASLSHHLMLGSRHDHGVGWEVWLAVLIDHGNKGDHLQGAVSGADCASQTYTYLIQHA